MFALPTGERKSLCDGFVTVRPVMLFETSRARPGAPAPCLAAAPALRRRGLGAALARPCR
jgi:ribosomal protein S18 acetylase RimI-like enzyme